MTEEPFRASTQKKLMDRRVSLLSKYSLLFLGRKSLVGLLKYELINLAVSWVPGALGFWLRRTFYPWLLGSVGRDVVFGRGVTLRHPHKISIGDGAVIDDYAVLDAKGEANRGISLGRNVLIGRHTILSCKEGSIRLGDYCNVSANCMILSETEVRLGRYCFLAGNCYLVAGGNHSFDQVSVPIMFQPSYSKGGIRVGEDVWLGAGVIVLDGVEIGRGSVVGAGSVISASLPEYSFARAARALKVQDRRTGKPRA
jgi:acetyltransferase-like isoleucine patch superfamily enzyme